MLALKARVFVFIPFLILLTSCLAARVDINRHPDYCYGPTNPGAITLYNGFLPKNEFIIIGQITFRQTRLISLSKTKQVVYDKAAQIGGDAVLVSHSEIQWMNYNRAVTSGSANVYNYGYNASGTWKQTTNTYQTSVPVARYYYLYVLRWKSRADIKDFRVGDAVPVTFSTSAARVKGQFTPAMAQNELREIESLLSQGRYNLSAERLAKLKNSIDSTSKFNRRNEYLARVHFLFGAYYVITDKSSIAIQHFENALEQDPEFRFNRSQFSDKVVELFEQVKGSPLGKPSEGEEIEQKVAEMPETSGEENEQVFFKGSQVRVVKDNAVMKVEPDEEAPSIRGLPLGALLTVEGKVGDWIKIKLSPDSDGIIVMGYVHVSFIRPETE